MTEFIIELEQRVANLEEVVALQSELILELNQMVKRGPAASEGISRPEGEDDRASVPKG